MGRVTPSVPALHGATLSIGICSTCKSPKLAKEWVEGIMIYKTGLSLHRGRERLRDWGREREKILHSSIYCMALKTPQPFYVYSRAQKRLHKSPCWTDGVLNCSQAAPRASWTVLKMCTCVLHEGRRSLSATGHNGSPTKQLITVNWGGAPGQFWLGNVQYAVKTAPCVHSPPSDLISTCDNTT